MTGGQQINAKETNRYNFTSQKIKTAKKVGKRFQTRACLILMFANCTFCRRNFVIEFQLGLLHSHGRRRVGEGQAQADWQWRQLAGLELQLWHRLALEFNYVVRLFFLFFGFFFCFGTQNRDKIFAKFWKSYEGGGKLVVTLKWAWLTDWLTKLNKSSDWIWRNKPKKTS